MSVKVQMVNGSFDWPLHPYTPEREAAFIRYLVLEGFVVSLWPQMCGRIDEEANWAFFFRAQN